MVSVLIITHNRIGAEFLRSAESIMGRELPYIRCIGIPGSVSPDSLGAYADEIRGAIEDLDQGDGVLILTDIIGATPNNLAQYFAAEHNVKIISGLNLPMLIRVINYGDQPLELLAKVGIVGANKGITKEIDI
jgi:PTS system ascorbate-specific IIA component